MDPVSSTTFIKRPAGITDCQEVLLYTKETLGGRLFLGLYQERRYVSALNQYRDVVIIHNEETELHSDLDKVRKKWSGVKDIKWVGITSPDARDLPKAYCFWVKLTNLPFGQYWFQIKCVQSDNGEILLRLKCIRKVQMSHPAVMTQNEKQKTENKNEKSEPSTSFNEVSVNLARGAISSGKKSWNDELNVILSSINWTNFVTVLRVTCAVVIAVVVGAISIIGHVGEFLLKLIRELSLLVNATTPVMIHLIDFFSKLVGGFLILLAGIFGRNVVRYGPPPAAAIHNVSQPPIAIDWRKRNQKLREELLSSGFRKR